MSRMHNVRLTASAALLAMFLTACGQMPEPATPTPPAAAPSPQAAIATPATPGAAEPTLGDLAARVNAAWSTVTSYEATFSGGSVVAAAGTPQATPLATPAATPVAKPATTFTSVRQVILPDRQRQVVTGLGDRDHEAIAFGDRLFIRGPLARQLAPGAAPQTWVAVESARLPADSVLSRLVGGLPEIPAPPLAAIPQRLWPQTLRDLGTTQFDGRICQVYGAVDTAAATGMRIDRAIAVDELDIPCYIETSTGGVVQGREEFHLINTVPPIEAPAAATPVSVPPALATPAVHD